MTLRNLFFAASFFGVLLSPLAAPAQTQAAMVEEADTAFRKADARLNATYRGLLASSDAEGGRKLAASEKAWLKYRDAQAELVADAHRGGSLETLDRVIALTTLTETRIVELKKLGESR